jgi:hypothetical protein
MRISSFLELIITLLLFLVIWILPRLIAARAADKKRKERKAPKAVPEPKQSWSKEIFSKLIDDTFLDTEKKKPPVQADTNTPEEPAVPVSVFLEEKTETEAGELKGSPPLEQEYQRDRQERPFDEQNRGLSQRVSSKNRRSPLQKAVIWKELLDPPKALRREPFP